MNMFPITIMNNDVSISLYTSVQIFLQNKFLKIESQKVYTKLTLITGMLYYLLYLPAVWPTDWLEFLELTQDFSQDCQLDSRPLPSLPINTSMILWTK